MITLKQLYQQITGDKLTHQTTIAAELRRENSARRKLLKLYIEGLSDRQVAERTGRSYGAARAMLLHTLHAIYKRVKGLPRYHLRGRRRTASLEAAKRQARAELPQLPPTSLGPARQAIADAARRRLS